jgi:dTDP-4-dehydrorhamnose reductase
MTSLVTQPKRILILGSSGFLGSNLRILFFDLPGVYFVHSKSFRSQTPKDFIVSDYSYKDLAQLVETLGIDVIVNCVGFTNVDACEDTNSLNSKLNLDLPLLLDDLCRSAGVKLVQISTDHYSSKEDIPRTESEIMSFVNEYGRMKLMADKSLLQNEMSLVVRTNFFGFDPSQRGNLLDWAKNKLENGESIFGFNDVFFTPISVSILASTLITLIERNLSGLFNVVSSESISKYQFLKSVAECLGCNQDLVFSNSIENSNLSVRRPKFLSLSNSKLKDELTTFRDISISRMISLELNRFTSKVN